MQDLSQCYIWRPRIPFGDKDEPCNLLSKLQRYTRVYDHVTSLSHVDDFAQACIELWQRRAPFGTYNVTNPGAVSTRQVVGMSHRILRLDRQPEFWAGDEAFYSHPGRAPRSSCILDVTKLLSTGVKMRPVKQALTDALRALRSSCQHLRLVEPAPALALGR